MPSIVKNKISVTLSQENFNEAMNALKTVSNLLPFLVGLNAADRQALPKMSNSNKPFVQDAYMAIKHNPEIFPGYIEAEELNKDLILFDQLDELLTLAQQITEKLRDTQIQTGSEAFSAALVIYKLIISASEAGVPGADTIYDQLAARFTGQGKVIPKEDTTGKEDKNDVPPTAK